MRRQAGTLTKDNGSAAIITAIAFTVLMGFVALATDIGALYLEHTKLARAVDAAALAGAQELPDTAEARAMALDYAARNNLPSGNLNISFSADSRDITVACSKEVNLFFARALGINTSTVNGRAVARIYPVSRTSGLLPIGIDESLLPLQAGHQYIIKVGSPATGWTGIIAYPGQSGSDDYRESALNGYDGVVAIGDVQEKETGNVTGPTIQGIQTRIDSAPGETWDNYSPDSRRIALVPIYRVQGSLPTDGVEITGFVSVFVEKVLGHGNDNEVYVKYVHHTVSNEGDDSITGSYLNTVRLVE
ncbi:MAG: hypothetical protein CVU89_05310 [Firmicutes bacterium HGW-Firmicutes-14]|nr:MAG: hypothetical protein CVU89_05310 [Firmicutes bacterium HGW-Firmicutes-14]